VFNHQQLVEILRKPKKDKDEKDLEKLAKKLLSMPHKPREESKVGKTTKPKKRLRRPVDSEANTVDSAAPKKAPRLRERSRASQKP
jgi:hypothetical protein